MHWIEWILVDILITLNTDQRPLIQQVPFSVFLLSNHDVHIRSCCSGASVDRTQFTIEIIVRTKIEIEICRCRKCIWMLNFVQMLIIIIIIRLINAIDFSARRSQCIQIISKWSEQRSSVARWFRCVDDKRCETCTQFGQLFTHTISWKRWILFTGQHTCNEHIGRTLFADRTKCTGRSIDTDRIWKFVADSMATSHTDYDANAQRIREQYYMCFTSHLNDDWRKFLQPFLRTDANTS